MCKRIYSNDLGALHLSRYQPNNAKETEVILQSKKQVHRNLVIYSSHGKSDNIIHNIFIGQVSSSEVIGQKYTPHQAAIV